MTDTPRCTACEAGAIDTEASHFTPDEPDAVWCSPHALPGDVPLAEVRENVWPELGQPQGYEGSDE